MSIFLYLKNKELLFHSFSVVICVCSTKIKKLLDSEIYNFYNRVNDYSYT